MKSKPPDNPIFVFVLRKIRLIIDPPASATFNMAVDEILMESQSEPETFPVLRIYSWDTPACSIGYFQNVDEIKKRFQCEKLNIPVVRRITGGGLVFHGEDLTFSLCFKNPNAFLPGDVKSSYLKINETLLSGFRKLYPKMDFADCRKLPSARNGRDRICFESPSCYDLILKGEKVVGSSQRRKEGTFLHQCSIFLKGKKENLIGALREGFKTKWGIDFLEKGLTAGELKTAREKERERYSLRDWAFLANSFLS